MASPGRIKGAPLRAFLDFLDTDVGPVRVRTAVTRWRDSGSPLSPDLPGYGVLGASWYPLVEVGALLDDVVGHPTDADLAVFASRAADAVMAKTLHGVHRAVFRVVGSPALMRQFRMSFWHQQYDTGEVTVVDTSPTSQRHEYHNWTGHHRIVCAATFACLVPMFRAMGLHGPRVHLLQCVSDKRSRFCAANIEWDR